MATIEGISDQESTTGRSGRGALFSVGAPLVLMLAVGAFLYVELFTHRSAIDTSYTSHAHVMLVDGNGSLIMGNHQSLWWWEPSTRVWTRFGAPMNHLMPLCITRVSQNVILLCAAQPATQALSNPEGTWRSADNGKAWRKVALPDSDVRFIAADPAVPGVVALQGAADGSTGGIGHGGIYLSTDSGVTWRRVQESLGGQPLQSLALVGTSRYRIFAVTPDAVYVGENAGRTWTQQSWSGTDTVLTLAGDPYSPNTVYAGSDGGLWLSRDGGQRWVMVLHTAPVTMIVPTSRMTDTYVVAGNVVQRWTGGQLIAGTGLPKGAPATLAVNPHNPNEAFAGYSFPLRVYRTTDGGRSWSQIL